MRTLTTILVLFALLTSACSSAGYSSSSNTCEELADEMVATIADLVTDNAGVSEADVRAAGADYHPENFGSYETRGNAIRARGEELGCSDDQLEELISTRLGSVNGDTYFGRILLEEIRTDGVFGEG